MIPKRITYITLAGEVGEILRFDCTQAEGNRNPNPIVGY